MSAPLDRCEPNAPCEEVTIRRSRAEQSDEAGFAIAALELRHTADCIERVHLEGRRLTGFDA